MFGNINWVQLAQDVTNPVSAVVRQATGDADLGKRVSLVATPGSAVAGAGIRALTGGNQSQQPQVQIAPGMTAQQAAQAREADFSTGRNRWNELIGARPDYREILARQRDMSQGLNAQEMTAARDQMTQGLNSQKQQAMRQLYANQAKSGIRGGMAGAQQARLQRQAMQDRQGAEQKMLLDNYALRRQGLQDYSQAVNRDISGEMGTGISEQQMGIADRTGGQTDAINRAMLQAAQNQRPPSIFSFLGL